MAEVALAAALVLLTVLVALAATVALPATAAADGSSKALERARHNIPARPASHYTLPGHAPA